MTQTVRIELQTRDFLELVMYVNNLQSNADPELIKLKKTLLDKLDRIIDHETYTKSKCALTPEERERARQEYLDRRGISEKFRY